MATNREKILKLKKLPELIGPDRPLLERLGMAYRTLVKERTQKGRDVDDKPFRPYSSGYLRTRRKKRRPTHPVDLTIDDVTGMISSITYRAEPKASRVISFISDSEKAQIARYHAVLGAGVNRIKRRFWGLSESQEERIRRIINVEIDKKIKSEL